MLAQFFFAFCYLRVFFFNCNWIKYYIFKATHSTSSLLRSQSWLCSHHRHHPTSPLNPLITADLQATHPPSHPLVFRCCTFLASLQSCKSFEYLCNSSNQTNGPTHSIHHSKSRPQQPTTTHISGAFCNSCSSLVALTHFQKSRVIIGLADICLKLAMFKSQKWWVGSGFWESFLLFYANTRKCPNFFFMWVAECPVLQLPPLGLWSLSATLCQF